MFKINTLYKIFVKEVNVEIEKNKNFSGLLITEDKILHLPEPVKKCYRYCGYLGREIPMNAQIIYDQFLFKTSPKQSWLEVNAQQINFIAEPCRLVYMKSRIKGFIPFEGRDKY